MGDAIESAFGRHFVAVFRNEAGVVGFDLQCDGNDFGRVAHFEVQLGLKRLLEPEDVAVLYVASVFAEMGGYSFGAGFLGDERGFNRIGLDQNAVRVTRVARLTQGGCVVDIDAETERHVQALPP